MWVTGILAPASDGSRLALTVGGREMAFHCGNQLELEMDGAWRRGRIEYSDRLGWYFTDNRQDVRLLVGDGVRVWDGRDWPGPPRDRDDERER